MSKTKTKIVVQDRGESGEEFSKRLNQIISDIESEFNVVSGIISIPTAASDGRLTLLLQWQYEVEKTNIMIQGLANDIIYSLEAQEKNSSSVEIEDKKALVFNQIYNFLKKG